MPITNFSVGFSWIFDFYSRAIRQSRSRASLASRCNLFASKSALRRIPTCAFAPTLVGRNEFTCSMRAAVARTCANQDDDTSINHSRQRPGRSTLFRQNLRGTMPAIRAKYSARTISSRYVAREPSRDVPEQWDYSDGVFRARSTLYRTPSATSINVG